MTSGKWVPMLESRILYSNLPRECKATRLTPHNVNYQKDNNPWNYEVSFGDSGYEVLPGIMYEKNIDKVISEVETAIDDLIRIKIQLVKFKEEEIDKRRQDSQ